MTQLQEERASAGASVWDIERVEGIQTRVTDLAGLRSEARSLHELAPYVGKMRPELAAWAIEQVTSPGDRVLDPFCGSGTVLLEGWSRKRAVVGVDLSPYAWLISTAKLLLYSTREEQEVEQRLEGYQKIVDRRVDLLDLDDVDPWIKSFYHPRTLKELLLWSWLLRRNKEALLLSSLMAIAHHQRPGFLSFPSSHTTPYLRTNRFPVDAFPELYEYRELRWRLDKKWKRALKDSHHLNLDGERQVILGDASNLPLEKKSFNAIITSPPYMGQLHYARDNRLRLALLGRADWREIDKSVSPNSLRFGQLISKCLTAWHPLLKSDGRVAILIGDRTNTVKGRLDTFLIDAFANSTKRFELEGVVESSIPDERRARKNCAGSSAEHLLIFRKIG